MLSTAARHNPGGVPHSYSDPVAREAEREPGLSNELQTQLFSPDLNVSPEARCLIAHVALVSGAEIAYPRLLRYLHISDEKKLRRVIAEAEDSGWIAVSRQTGRGHNPRFDFTPPKNGTLSNTPPKNGTLNADRVPENAGLNGASSSLTPSSSPSHAHVIDLDELRPLYEWVPDAPWREMAEAVGGTVWARGVLGEYGPGRSKAPGLFNGLDPEEVVAAIEATVRDFASKAEAFDPKLFRSFVYQAAKQVRNGRASQVEAGVSSTRSGPAKPDVAGPPSTNPKLDEWRDRMLRALDEERTARPVEVEEWRAWAEPPIRRNTATDPDLSRLSQRAQEQRIELAMLRSFAEKFRPDDPDPRLKNAPNRRLAAV